MAKQKFYVVWEGVTPGVYTSWTDCQLQIKGYEAAKYKSFDTREEAERALTMSPYAYIGKNAKAKSGGPKPSSDTLPSCVIDNSLSMQPVAVIRDRWNIAAYTLPAVRRFFISAR